MAEQAGQQKSVQKEAAFQAQLYSTLSSSREHVKKRQLDQTVKKEETTPGCPATTPRGPGTAPAAEHSSQWLSALQWHLHQPLKHIVDLQSVSHASSLHSSLALPLAAHSASSCSGHTSGQHGTPALRLQPTSLGQAQWRKPNSTRQLYSNLYNSNCMTTRR